jgi:hypothetical protein
MMQTLVTISLKYGVMATSTMANELQIGVANS